MPRKARILVPNCPHHVVQRGHNRKAVFIADTDYEHYLENLKAFKEVFDIRVYAWCLMTNHVHLILEPGSDETTISLLMKRLAGRQSALVNKLEKRSGSLWEGRFKASPIQKEVYLMACVRYVEMNPVRAGMVFGAEQYKWSSYRERLGVVDNGLLDHDECYLGLGARESERVKRYKQFVGAEVNDSEIMWLRNSLRRNQLTGNQKFVDEIEERIGIRIEARGRGRPRKEK
jgi:putative transposase